MEKYGHFIIIESGSGLFSWLENYLLNPSVPNSTVWVSLLQEYIKHGNTEYGSRQSKEMTEQGASFICLCILGLIITVRTDRLGQVSNHKYQGKMHLGRAVGKNAFRIERIGDNFKRIK